MSKSLHHARSSFSEPRITIWSASSGNGRCSAFASSQDARILALGGMLLGSAILALLVVLVRGQHSQAGVIEQPAVIKSTADLGNRRLEVRSFMIRSQLAQAMSPIVIIGDSITEAALLPSSVCGHDVINAGIGGMTVGSYLPLAKQLLAGRRVQSIVIALGTNDSGVLSTAHIEQDYASLIDELAKHATKILLAGLPPFEMSGALAGRYFDQASADRNNGAIRSLAAARNLPFIDLRNAMHGDSLTVASTSPRPPTINGARPFGAIFIQRLAASIRMALAGIAPPVLWSLPCSW